MWDGSTSNQGVKTPGHAGPRHAIVGSDEDADVEGGPARDEEERRRLLPG